MSKRKPKLIETDYDRRPVNKTNKEFLKQNDIRRHSRYASKGAVFAENFNITIQKMLTKPVFEEK